MADRKKKKSVQQIILKETKEDGVYKTEINKSALKSSDSPESLFESVDRFFSSLKSRDSKLITTTE